jgi:ubiquinone/menaquinone biosynthesis C-methylase UbiE
MARRGPRQRLFDLWSLVYDAPWVQQATYRPVHNAVLRALGQDAGTRLLDIGCGTGQLTDRLARKWPSVTVVGCDFSEGMLARAAARSPDLSWVRADAGCLPFEDQAFDLITSTEAFHWFPDQDAALAEFFRVLAPGGQLLLALINTPARALSDLLYAGSRVMGEPFYWPSKAEMRDRLEAAGFRVHEQRRIFRWPGILLPPVLTHARRPGPPRLASVRPRSTYSDV